MDNPVEITESPNKLNICYSVTYISKDTKPEECFAWVANGLKHKGTNAERVLIYCQTIKQCSIVYATIRGIIGDSMYLDPKSRNPRHVVLEMLHSCTPKNKENILKSFQDPQGCIRVLITTIAFGMGIHCKGVHHTIHFGPPKNPEAYVQESGRAGRDGKPSISHIIYQGLLLTHVEREMKTYVKTSSCRREILMRHFGIVLDSKQTNTRTYML